MGTSYKFKIAIIAHNCRNGGGLIATKPLLEAMFSDHNSEFFVIYPKGCGYEEILNHSNCISYGVQNLESMWYRLYFDFIKMPFLIKKYNPDVIFAPGNVGVIFSRFPQVLFVRNAYLYENYSRYISLCASDRLRLWLLRTQLKLCLESSLRQILVQTSLVKYHFCERWKFPEDKVKVIRFPVPSEIKQAFNITSSSILTECQDAFKVLFLTRYLPHRNPEIVLELCRKYHSQLRKEKICFFMTLDLKDKYSCLTERLLSNVQKEGLGDLIVNLGPLSRRQVIQYYMQCDLLWLHTFIETLCLPFLEAMTLGVPILAPDFDFAHYVCSKAACYYDPTRLDSIYACLLELKYNSALRNNLIEEGFREISNREKFSSSWDETAQEVLECLKKMV